jgi:ribosomal protein S18 acetylase RimI-like enzyme
VIDSKFSHDKADQIADLINRHNLLKKEYTAGDIKRSKAVYLPITIGDLVLASVAFERLNFLLTEIKHLVVQPQLRKLGIGKRLVYRVIERATTPYLIASIRSSNEGSIALFKSLGFKVLSEVDNEGTKLAIVGRERVTQSL